MLNFDPAGSSLPVASHSARCSFVRAPGRPLEPGEQPCTSLGEQSCSLQSFSSLSFSSSASLPRPTS